MRAGRPEDDPRLLIAGLDEPELLPLCVQLSQAGCPVQIVRPPQAALDDAALQGSVVLLAAFPAALGPAEDAARHQAAVLWAVEERDLPAFEARFPGAPFVVRPASAGEVLVRARRLGAAGGDPRLLQLGALEIALGGRWARLDGDELDLTDREFTLLLALARNAGSWVTREWLMRELWPGAPATSRALNIVMCRLRTKLGPYGDAIRTRTRGGYRLAPDVVEAAREPAGPAETKRKHLSYR